MSGDSIYFNYNINGVVVSEPMILTGVPLPGDTLAYNFNTTADFSQPGT